MKNRIAIHMALGTSFLLAGCGTREKPASAAGSAAPVVKTTRVELKSVESQLSIPGRVQADPSRVVRVYPPAGGRLLRVDVRPGDRVHKGEALASMESSDVAQARADYGKAKTEMERNQRAFDRAKLLFEHKVLSQREYEDTQASYEEARSELDRSTDRLRVMGVSAQGPSNQVSLLAPRDGVVLDLSTAPGELQKSTDNATPICTIADLGVVWVIGDVYEKDVAGLRRGEPVDISIAAFPDLHLRGKLDLISDTVDPATRALKVRIVLENPKWQLKPEMFATIRVKQPAAEAIVLPASSLLREGGDTAVMVQTAPDKYERRLVKVASADADRIVIAGGLKSGEMVVTEGAALVRGGGEAQ